MYATNKVVLIALVALLVGVGAGYLYAAQPQGEAVDHSHVSVGNTMDSMTSSLAGKKGAELEHAFLDGMIEHHEGAIEMAMVLKAGTTRPELLKMADDIVAVQSAEIAMMRAWLREWFGQ